MTKYETPDFVVEEFELEDILAGVSVKDGDPDAGWY